MSYRQHNVYVTVASGETESGEVHLSQAEKVSLQVPSLTAVTTLSLLAAAEHTGTFLDVLNSAGSAVQYYPVGSGPSILVLADKFAGLSHAKIKLSAPVTDVRTFAFMVKL